jgi:hypothetical protein
MDEAEIARAIRCAGERPEDAGVTDVRLVAFRADGDLLSLEIVAESTM